MSKWKVMTGCALLLAFVAGIPVGWVFDPFEQHQDPTQYAPNWLNDELVLTVEQEDKMREIWSKTAHDLKVMDKSQAARDKDERVIAILSSEQKTGYEEIMVEFRKRRDEIDKERRARHHAAVDETKAILTDEQLEKFEELLVAHKERRRLPMFGGTRSKSKK